MPTSPDPSGLPADVAALVGEGAEVEVIGPADEDGEAGAEPDDLTDPIGVGAPSVAGRPTEERVSGFDGIGTRREARERALALLYEAEQKSFDPYVEVIGALPVAPEEYAAEVVAGVSDRLAGIDDLISRYSVGWPIPRMPAVDRSLLRIGTWELAYTDVPVGVAISEAVELAKRYSTDNSPAFVNGLLGRIAAEVRSPG